MATPRATKKPAVPVEPTQADRDALRKLFDDAFPYSMHPACRSGFTTGVYELLKHVGGPWEKLADEWVHYV